MKTEGVKKVLILLLVCNLLTLNSFTQQWWLKINEDSTNGTFLDTRDSSIYIWVKIGCQIWMAQNLNIGELKLTNKDGQVIDYSSERFCYKDIEENCSIYGGLYTDYVINQTTFHEGDRSICPQGWHLPAVSEWQILFDYLGGDEVAGSAMKEAGTEHWKKPNAGSTNSSGFTALPDGICLYDENSISFIEMGQRGCFWTSTDSFSFLYLTKDFQTICLFKNKGRIIRDKSFGHSALSVRCIKDD